MGAPPRRGKETKLIVFTDGEGVPLAVDAEAANGTEVDPIEPLIDSAVPESAPPRLIDDCAAGSDPLRKRLAGREIELVCPHLTSPMLLAFRHPIALLKVRSNAEII